MPVVERRHISRVNGWVPGVWPQTCEDGWRRLAHDWRARAGRGRAAGGTRADLLLAGSTSVLMLELVWYVAICGTKLGQALGAIPYVRAAAAVMDAACGSAPIGGSMVASLPDFDLSKVSG